MKKLHIPNSPLILYAKGWINFDRFHSDCTQREKLCLVVKMCNYIPNKNPTMQILMLFEQIVEFFKQNAPEKLTRRMTSPYQFIAEAKSKFYHYDLLDFDDAIIQTVMSELFMLDINDYYIEPLIYNRKNGFTPIGTLAHPGRTYKEMQWHFVKTFKHMIDPVKEKQFCKQYKIC